MSNNKNAPDNTDARKLTATELRTLRIRGVKAVQAGEHPDKVAVTLGVSRAAVFNWLSLYRSGGWQALEAKSRGGRKRKLSPEALQDIAAIVLNDDPRQHLFSFALWTLEFIQKIILQRHKVELSRYAISKILKQLGLSPQRPLWRAWQQDPKKVEAWLEDQYPQIKRRAKKLGAEIYFGDEAGVRSDGHAGTTWGIKGMTPIVKATGARFGLNVISAVSNRGKLRFMITEGTVGAAQFIEFLKRLLVGAANPVFLIVDGHPAHRSKMVKEFVAQSCGELELYNLPAYSPELNPDELVWKHLKNDVVGKQTVRDKSELRKLVDRTMRSIQKLPNLLRSFFQHPETRYAC